MAQTNVYTCLFIQETSWSTSNTFLTRYRSGGTPDESQHQVACELQGRWIEAPGLLAFVLPVNARRWVFGRQHNPEPQTPVHLPDRCAPPLNPRKDAARVVGTTRHPILQLQSPSCGWSLRLRCRWWSLQLRCRQWSWIRWYVLPAPFCVFPVLYYFDLGCWARFLGCNNM
jgi:hypothetical protein